MKDFSFQGKVYLGTRLAGGKPGELKWVGDAPKCEVTLQVDSEQRTESYSGNRLTSARLQKSKEATIALTLNWATPDNLALGLYGSMATVAGGSVTGELLPTDLQADSVVSLDHGDVSALVITDSDGTPAPLAAGTNYAIDSAKGGLVRIIDPTGFTQPFKAAYSYGGSVDVAMFTAQPPERYLLLDGVNTLDKSRVIMRLYRVQFDPTSNLPLINDSFGQLELSGAVLFDSESAADAALGGFGKIQVIDAE